MKRGRAGGVACVGAAVMFVTVGCGGGSSSKPAQAVSTSTTVAAAAAGGPASVIVTEKDFAINALETGIKAGAVNFNVANQGPSAHEFLIFKTDLAQDKLPLGPDGRVNEDDSSVNKVFDSGDSINPNAAKTFNATLAPGHYVLVCNLAPNHYMAGMHADFTVS